MAQADKKVPISIHDVAAAAGVSVATVSRVLRGEDVVKDDLREKVQRAIGELGYKPQRIHKRAKSAPWVAILSEVSDDAFFTHVIAAIEEKASEDGLLINVIHTSRNSQRKEEVLREVEKKEWAGIISAGVYQSEVEWMQFYERTQAPMVLMNTRASHPKIATLQVDFERAAYQAIQYLIDLGHSQIAYVGDYANEFSAAEFRGVQEALTGHGDEYPPEYFISVAHSIEGASQAASRIMMLPEAERPTALMTFDDEFAIQVMHALHYYQIRIPEDISMIGFDNIPMSNYTFPPLTTIDVPKRRIGRQLVDMLQNLIAGESVGNTIVDGTLVVRKSTGPAPNRANGGQR